LNTRFYNTTREDGQYVISFTAINTANDFSILEIFQDNPDKSFTPYEVGDELKKRGNNMLQSSVKRGITDLTTNGLLINTDVKVKERYGRPNYKWKLKTNDNE
jgi:hypothetical protein